MGHNKYNAICQVCLDVMNSEIRSAKDCGLLPDHSGSRVRIGSNCWGENIRLERSTQGTGGFLTVSRAD